MRCKTNFWSSNNSRKRCLKITKKSLTLSDVSMKMSRLMVVKIISKFKMRQFWVVFNHYAIYVINASIIIMRQFFRGKPQLPIWAEANDKWLSISLLSIVQGKRGDWTCIFHFFYLLLLGGKELWSWVVTDLFTRFSMAFLRVQIGEMFLNKFL